MAMSSYMIQAKFNQKYKKGKDLCLMWPLANVKLQDSSKIGPKVSNRQGFMSNVTTGKCQVTGYIYNPMILVEPQTKEAVYSRMMFACAQARQVSLCCTKITFHQPLSLKPYKIKEDN